MASKDANADKDPNKGYVAIFGWSLNAIDAIDRFDRRYIIVAPSWAKEYADQNDIPFMSWDFERLNERSFELGEKLQEMSPSRCLRKLSSGQVQLMRCC